jgi:hypothetical protein
LRFLVAAAAVPPAPAASRSTGWKAGRSRGDGQG